MNEGDKNESNKSLRVNSEPKINFSVTDVNYAEERLERLNIF